MSSHYIIKPIEIIKTGNYINRIIPAEGFIDEIEFYDDMIFMKLKDNTGLLDLTLLDDVVKKYKKKLKKIKNYKKTKILVKGELKEFPSGIESERGYEMIVTDLKILNRPSLFNHIVNSNETIVSGIRR